MLKREVRAGTNIPYALQPLTKVYVINILLN